MAPLAGLDQSSFTPAWNRIGSFVFRHGEHFYNFEGLRSYKAKFAPALDHPLPGRAAGILVLPSVLADISTLIAGRLERTGEEMSAQWHRLLWLVLLAWTSHVDAAQADLTDLSLIEVPAGKSSASNPTPLAILITGDGGWARIDRPLSSDLAANGIPVVGFDSLHYFWKSRTPEETAHDVSRTMKHYMDEWSRGACHAHRLLARRRLSCPSSSTDCRPTYVEHVCSIALVGLSESVVFEVQMKQWLPGAKPEGKAVAPRAREADAVPDTLPLRRG